MAQPSGTFLVSDLITEIKRSFGDESGVQIENSDIIRWANMGLVEIANKVRILQKISTMPGTTGTETYALPPDILNLDGVRYGAVALTYVNTEEALRTLGVQLGEKGQPLFYSTYGNNLSRSL